MACRYEEEVFQRDGKVEECGCKCCPYKNLKQCKETSQMDLTFVAELMSHALTMLKWEKHFKVIVKDNRLTVGGNITLYQDNVEVIIPETIASPAKTEKVLGWIVDIATETPPSRWEPGDVDIKIVHTSESILSCIDYICELCFNDLKNGNFRYLEHCIEIEERKND
jgi:hypothetical protein